MSHYLEDELQDLMKTDDTIFRFLQRGALDGVWYWDLENPEHEWMSEAFWGTFGIDPTTKQHLASEWQDLIHPDDLDVALANFKAHCADENAPYDQVVRYRHADGSTVWIRCRGLAIRDDDGKPTRMLGVHTDVTALKEAEETNRRLAEELQRKNDLLQKSVEQLTQAGLELQVEVDEQGVSLAQARQKMRTNAAVVDTMQDAVVASDLDGNINAWNHAAEHLFGWHADEVMGKHYGFLVPEDSKSHVRQVIQDARAGGGASFNAARLHKDGHLVPVHISASPIRDDSDNVVGTAAVLRDIREQQSADEERSALIAALEQSNDDLEKFAYVASHDLQEPLRSVASYVELLMEKYEGALDERGQKYAAYVVDGAKRMGQMLDDLLELSKVREAALDDDVDLNLVMERVERAMNMPDDARLDVQPLPHVAAGETLMQRLLQNLVHNSIKFRRTGIPLVIRVSSDCQQNGDVHIRVEDNGIGIRDDDAERIFDMFQRLHGRATYEGNGMGLAHASRIVRHVGGHIWASGELGQGTTVTFAIPASRVLKGDR